MNGPTTGNLSSSAATRAWSDAVLAQRLMACRASTASTPACTGWIQPVAAA
jgi:hypothetical protein